MEEPRYSIVFPACRSGASPQLSELLRLSLAISVLCQGKKKLRSEYGIFCCTFSSTDSLGSHTTKGGGGVLLFGYVPHDPRRAPSSSPSPSFYKAYLIFDVWPAGSAALRGICATDGAWLTVDPLRCARATRMACSSKHSSSPAPAMKPSS